MNNNSNLLSIKLIIILLIICFLNLTSFFCDNNKLRDELIEEVEANIYFLKIPIFFEIASCEDLEKTLVGPLKESEFELLKLGIKGGEITLLKGDSVLLNKKIFILFVNKPKTIDNIICTSIYLVNNFYILIENENAISGKYFRKKENTIKKDKNIALDITSLNKYLIMKNVFFKAHFIDKKYIVETQLGEKISKLNTELEPRLLRAIKERSCLVIINNMNDKVTNDFKEKIIKKAIFIKSFKFKIFLYLLIGFISIFIYLLIFKLYFSKFSKLLTILFILNSCFLILNYIFFFFNGDLSCSFNINNKYFSITEILIINIAQITTFIIYIFLVILILKKKEVAGKYRVLNKIITLFIITLQNALIINTIFFINKIYWLKPVQYLTNFFYFFPIIPLFLTNIKREKKYIILYFLFFISLYLLLKLKDYGYLNTSFEIKLRNLIESILPARFRFKEFLCYSAFINIYLLMKNRISPSFIKKILNLKNRFKTIYYYLLLFPFLTIINSYYHSYTPIYISFLRTFFAICFSSLTILPSYIFIKLKKYAVSNYKQLNNN